MSYLVSHDHMFVKKSQEELEEMQERIKDMLDIITSIHHDRCA